MLYMVPLSRNALSLQTGLHRRFILGSIIPPTPALQQFFEAQINLPSSPFSIKKGEGDWFTLVKLRDEHKWYSALTGVALQVATETLNKVITMLCGSGTNQRLISHLGKNCD